MGETESIISGKYRIMFPLLVLLMMRLGYDTVRPYFLSAAPPPKPHTCAVLHGSGDPLILDPEATLRSRPKLAPADLGNFLAQGSSFKKKRSLSLCLSVSLTLF